MKDERTNARKECEILVQNIAQSHARLAPGIQVAIENQWDNDFSECLRAFVAEKEEEIRDVCSSHYQEFVQSIEDIVQIKCDVNDLQELVDVTTPLVQGNDMVVACRNIRQNIDTSIERLQQCQRIVECTAKVDKYIHANQLYHALKVLDTIKVDVSSFRVPFLPCFLPKHDILPGQPLCQACERLDRIHHDPSPCADHEEHSIGAQAMKRGDEAMPPRLSSDESGGLHLPSLEELSLHAQNIRATNALHADYCQQALALLAPMLRTLHVYKYLHTTSELAKFYNTNRMPQLQFSAFISGDIGTISADKFAAQVNAACLSVLQSLSGLMMALTLKLQSPKVIVDIKRNATLCARALGDDVHQFPTSILLDAFRGMGDFYRKKIRVHIKVPSHESQLRGHWGYFVREDTCEALIELNVVLNELIESHSDLQISQAVITGANSSYLSGACDVFGAVLHDKIDLWERRAVKKIDDLIGSFYFLEWVPAEPTKQADPCMIPIKEAVHFASCIHINKALEQVLVGPTVKKVNVTGILNFKRNLGLYIMIVYALVQYAGTCGVGQLKDCFMPMTQLVDLIVSDDLERLDHTTFKCVASGGKYTHVMPDHVVAVVEKFKETSVAAAAASSMFFKSNKSKAETTVGLKKSVIDAVLKQLKTIGPMHK
ncbi:hypothetical protein DYB37_006222 [Aphanomyces astaci]|uniref:Exocyst complex component n=1 Tax=Aphanomyces astaci TaxID=112090 RepID=A0A418DEM0_APHAT|nr:hypothetical protein DYB35_004541 [Aphanomyces astaci]RHZ34763.1 hypothetical protein DYB37_006222 [Aphanomyces astaci]